MRNNDAGHDWLRRRLRRNSLWQRQGHHRRSINLDCTSLVFRNLPLGRTRKSQRDNVGSSSWRISSSEQTRRCESCCRRDKATLRYCVRDVVLAPFGAESGISVTSSLGLQLNTGSHIPRSRRILQSFFRSGDKSRQLSELKSWVQTQGNVVRRSGRLWMILLVQIWKAEDTIRPETNSNDFGGFGINSRFEFDFRRCENDFFEGFEFLVCSCECPVACLCPRNSISNVVASMTIDDNIYICKMYIYKRDVAKRHETIVEGRKHIHLHINVHFHTLTLTLTLTLTFTITITLTLTHTHTHTHTHIHVHIHMHIHTYTKTRACTCAFACACARGRGGRGGEWCWVGRVGGWVGEYVLVRVCLCVLCVVLCCCVFVCCVLCPSS